MPLLARPGTTPVTPPPPTRAPAGQPKRITWTSAAGDVINLSTRSDGRSTMTGRLGFGPVDPALVTDTMPSGASLVRAHREQPRLMTTPLLVEGTTETEYLTRYDALQKSLRHPIDVTTGLPTPGTITVELPDGSSRSIGAYYYAGGSLTEDQLDDVLAHWSMLPSLQWYAPVPTFEGAPIERTWPVQAAATPFYPLYPMRYASSQVLAHATVTNVGDADAYPVWRLTGPGLPTIENADTGESLQFTETIPSGVTVTVDCRPVELAPATGLTAIDDQDAGDDSDWWDRLVDYPTFWTLPPGTTNLALAMTSSTADSIIELSAVTRWLGGW